MGGGGRRGMGDGEGARPWYTNILGSGEFMSVGITNFLNVEQLWTCSSYLHALKNVTALQVQSQMPLSQMVRCMCVTAHPLAHSTVQGPCSKIYSNEDTLQSTNFNFNLTLFFSFLLLLLHLLLCKF